MREIKNKNICGTNMLICYYVLKRYYVLNS